jgi:NADPH:quinone reductase
MVNGAFHLLPAARDFRFEQLDALGQFLDRKRVEVLPGQLRGGVVLATGKIGLVHCSAASGAAWVMSSRARVIKLVTDRAFEALTSRLRHPIQGARGSSMTRVPQLMTAIDPEVPGGPEVLVPVERPVPQPGAGEVLIRVAAAGVNRPDVVQRLGAYPPPPGVTTIPGLEVAGEVVAMGAGVPAELMHQRVCALIAGGGYAEYVVAPAVQCLTVPDALTLVEAAAMPETLFTVWTNLFERGYAAEGETVLVHGGTSGIGTMATSLCKLFGVRVIVTAGSDEKVAACLAHGADHAINYKTEDFVARVRDLTEGRGVNVVLDMVGGDYVARNIRCMADDGRHVSIAAQGGMQASVPVFEIMRRRLTLTGSTLRARDVAFKGLVADELSRNVWPHVEAGRLKPVIDRTFPLAEAAEAHRHMESGTHMGKIVLLTGA